MVYRKQLMFERKMEDFPEMQSINGQTFGDGSMMKETGCGRAPPEVANMEGGLTIQNVADGSTSINNFRVVSRGESSSPQSFADLLVSSNCISLIFLEDGADKNFPRDVFVALEEAGLRTFKDDQKIEREAAWKHIIQHSNCCIIILTEGYASSKQRLDELDMIVDMHSDSLDRILPIYYGVSKSDLRSQSGSISPIFMGYEKEIKDETDDEKKQKLRKDVTRWRDALRQVVAESPGLNFPNGAAKGCRTGKEILIKKIVLEARETAKHKVSRPPQQRLVGVDTRAMLLQDWVDN